MKAKSKTNQNILEAEAVSNQLNRDVRDSLLVVSLLVNAYLLVAWLIIQISTRYDAALIDYIQTK